MLQKTVVLIPAYQPDERLPAYVHSLLEAGIGSIVVVDDGGGKDYDAIFGEISQIAAVSVLRYTPNQGKGHALKEGLRYIQEHLPDARVIVTADADGQHQTEDVIRLSTKQAEYGDGLLLGSRDFSLPEVPFKSRNGNRITSNVFKLLYGQWVEDTQTGLRAFCRELLPLMLKTQGERYEYEMKVLIECAQRNIPMRPMTIATIYENNNEGSHFHPVRDSARIYSILFSSFLKFSMGSLLSFAVDYIIFLCINTALSRNYPELDETVVFILPFVKSIAIATIGARICSGLFNYFFNKLYTFRERKAAPSSFWRYLCIFFTCMILSAATLSGLHLLTGINEHILKIPVDLLIFLLNYNVQKRWVFK